MNCSFDKDISKISGAAVRNEGNVGYSVFAFLGSMEDFNISGHDGMKVWESWVKGGDKRNAVLCGLFLFPKKGRFPRNGFDFLESFVNYGIFVVSGDKK